MSLRQPLRPWYCYDGLVDAYLKYAREGGDLRVLKTIRALESLIVNAGIIGMTIAALYFGEANSYVVLAAIGTLGLLNGLFVADYAALARALAEMTSVLETETGSRPDEDSEE